MSDSTQQYVNMTLDRIYNAKLLQTSAVSALQKQGFEIINTDSVSGDIKLRNGNASCLIDVEGTVRWPDA